MSRCALWSCIRKQGDRPLREHGPAILTTYERQPDVVGVTGRKDAQIC